jgi:membrane-bound lytic murein transglycosylase D
LNKHYLLLPSIALIVSLGCSTFLPRKQTVVIDAPVQETVVIDAPVQETIIIDSPVQEIDDPAPPVTAYRAVEETPSSLMYAYEAETDILDQVEILLEEAAGARLEEYYGLAQSKIEEALTLAHDVDLVLIQDPALVERFTSTLAALAQESGRILVESSIIAEEDPMAWLEDVDIEQFRSGQWTDEELEQIVKKIALKCDVPIEFNKKVRNAIYFFQNGRRDEMVQWQKRSGRYLNMMREIFAEEELPQDLVYLSMIESGFKPAAYSSARAVGLWQFMYATGKIYGLDRNTWMDERRDPVLSTRAAASHLKDLYKISDDWNIVMALYNHSPQRITRQLAQTQNIEFWDMQLPRQTQNYVPFFMAATVISKAPEVFGFDDIEKDPPFEYDIVEVHPYTDLSTAAECAGTDTATLKELNPALLRDRVPPGDEKYELRIPKDASGQFIAAYKEIPVETYQPPKVEYVNVQRGDTFSGIAARNRVSISALRAANPQISNINRLSIGQRIYMPGTVRTSSSRQPVVVDRENTQTYTVRKNDTLGIIAHRYGTTYPVIQALNNMGSSTRIYPGDKLIVPSAASASSGASSTSNTATSNTSSGDIVYVVRKNDTVYEISLSYGVDYRKVLEYNQISNHRLIKPGDRILIPKE